MKIDHKKMYLNGELVESSTGKSYKVICPGDESIVATIAWANKEDTERALESAQAGFKIWSVLSVDKRVEWMEKLRSKIIENGDRLRTSIMYELGKTWEGTEEDLKSITDSLRYYGEVINHRKDIPIEDRDGTHIHYLRSQPLGVVVAFLAYNFPLLNLGFKLGPALAAGCSIILKPSEYSPLSAYIIGELCADIDFPPGVINILCGDLKDVGIPLSESKIPKLITMIGSTGTAQKLIAQGSMTSIKRYSMECGGNAPFIVFSDADMDKAVSIGAALKLGNTGQICVAPNRFYIHENIIDTYVRRLTDKFEKASIGFGKEENPDMGPLANKPAVDKMKLLVKESLEQGGSVIYGGTVIDRAGYYFTPTIIQFDDNNAKVFQEEIFGPIAFIAPFSSKEEVIELANDTTGGLASYVFSKDEETLRFFADKLEFGEIQLNGVKYDIYLPHGGIKDSGIGVDCSEYALDDYLVRKRVSQALA